MSRKLQDYLEEFFRAKEGEEIEFEGEEKVIRDLSLILRALSQEVGIEEKNGRYFLHVRKKRP
ncbi:hypothetical protein GWK48_00690 [Metallosphaera tengchongensis]|uniref:Uncharacterized protein n=1 Tax=Metallosphaera tengchongensis TaxID=1532350 RepID=A0A6N0NVE7_9CREN|nr:hypothetical protein [Metallosphaera tengchongensis]QKQ99110.1 hypothetical protein GWK48_00690 [Metallosphaera tengchongensis]